ncbi:MAG: Tim44/TimA family putative adaptor protein [Hyphomonadaceae bacterium]|nr:Tim44/TimA family putative adaptor protein [Hyphomonadaceae bacterium]
MSNQVFEVLILAVVAAVVIGRLFSVLGQRRGSEGPTQPTPARPAPVEVGAGPGPLAQPFPPASAQPGAPGVAAVMQADPSFDPVSFVEGARTAYEMIVQAFAAGDRATLQPLLNPRVFETYDKAITDRLASGGKGPELVRLKTAELVDARLEGDIARIAVRFEAELAEGAYGLRETKERWTFERDVRSRDPNWRLSSVAQA